MALVRKRTIPTEQVYLGYMLGKYIEILTVYILKSVKGIKRYINYTECP
jgi:hypothetical protein